MKNLLLISTLVMTFNAFGKAKIPMKPFHLFLGCRIAGIAIFSQQNQTRLTAAQEQGINISCMKLLNMSHVKELIEYETKSYLKGTLKKTPAKQKRGYSA